MSTPLPDRLADILATTNTSVTGIDFIFVDPASELTLDVHFLRAPSALSSLATPLNLTLAAPADVSIYCPAEGNAVMPVTALSWPTADVLRVTVDHPGDFALYRMKLSNAAIDPYYNDVVFSFKAGCPSRLDCESAPEDCPPDMGVDFPIDYLARDFHSLKRALMEFASLRYPAWPDRLEADAGVMMAELMSAVGDEMAYHQDRIAREGYLETATQRRSLRRLARLVDYEIHDGLGAAAWVGVIVNKLMSGGVPAGTGVWATSNSGQQINFEVGQGLSEDFTTPQTVYAVDVAINALAPHIWDKNDVCLAVGTTQLWLEGDQTGVLKPPKWAIIQTYPANPAQQQRTQLIQLTQVTKVHDPVLGVDTTLVQWGQAQALPFEFDLTVLKLHGNILPVTAGKTLTAYFITGGDFPGLPPAQQQALLSFAGLGATTILERTVERQGRDGTISYRYTLPGSDAQNLVWLGVDTASAQPEVLLRALTYDAGTASWKIDTDDPWTWRQALVGGEYSSEEEDRDYTFDDGNWTRVVGYIDDNQTYVHRDYAAGTGLSLLFGDGEFGLVPAPNTIFRVDYRLGGGNISNVAAKAITHFTQVNVLGQPLIKGVINGLAAVNGLDPQSPDEVRQLAPQAYQAVTYRAVQPQDYADAAALLPWVQQAGCAFRWTGSWVSAFVTADPEGQIGLSSDEVQDLVYQEDRYRQAGREVIISQPIYANLDMEIEVCARPDAYAGEVRQRVMTALFGSNGYPAVIGYFSPDRFTFGTVLERSTLEAAIQEVPGVLAVEWIRYRRRGWFDWKFFREYSYDPGNKCIICLANDPVHPEEGILTLNVHGGL
jgi:hypothetical protein